MTLALVLALALLEGCVAGPRVGKTGYQPRERNGDGYGYSDMQLNGRSYEVYFAGVSEQDAREGAMLRAAELTLKNRFDGFTISADDEHPEQKVRGRMVVFRVKRNMPVRVITIDMLMRVEFDGIENGRVYDAHLLMRQHFPGM